MLTGSNSMLVVFWQQWEATSLKFDGVFHRWVKAPGNCWLITEYACCRCYISGHNGKELGREGDKEVLLKVKEVEESISYSSELPRY